MRSQGQLGWEHERGSAGKECEQRTAHREEHRIRCADAASSRRQNDSGNKKTEELFEFSHRADLSRLRRR
jgi:hypothetical protein